MFRTGDYGRMINGQIYYEGRADSQIKVRGHRVDLNEVNAVVNHLEEVSFATVLCYKPGEPEQVKDVVFKNNGINDIPVLIFRKSSHLLFQKRGFALKRSKAS